MSESKIYPHHSEVSFVETHQHPSETVTIIERWIPAKKGDYAPCLFGNWEEGYTPMKLESRRTVDGREI